MNCVEWDAFNLRIVLVALNRNLFKLLIRVSMRTALLQQADRFQV